ncbi:MAG: hypothetical protein V1773_06675 [bacterium]
MIEILKLIYDTFISWISDFIWFLIDILENILPEFLRGIGVLIVFVGYIIVLFTMGFLTLKFIKKKKYWASTSFFIIFLLMFIYITISMLNIANKGFE